MHQSLLNLNFKIISKSKTFSYFRNSIETVNSLMWFTRFCVLQINFTR